MRGARAGEDWDRGEGRRGGFVRTRFDGLKSSEGVFAMGRDRLHRAEGCSSFRNSEDEVLNFDAGVDRESHRDALGSWPGGRTEEERAEARGWP
jgi:hypothetical protein